MSRKRKNAGEGYGYMFSGAFTKKADAVKKERQRKGSFVKGIPTNKGYRYVVMTPRDNPRRRRQKSFNPAIQELGGGRYQVDNERGSTLTLIKKPWGWEVHSENARTRAAWRGMAGVRSYSTLAEVEKHYKAFRGIAEHIGGNPMDLTVMAANPSERNPQEIVVRPGQTITLRVNPLEPNPPAAADLCGAMIGGYPCTRQKGHRGPHLPQGATLRPQSRHNWGRQSNPAFLNRSAEDIRDGFIGAPVDLISTRRVDGMPDGNYALLGKFLCLYVKPLSGGQVAQLYIKGAKVVSDESAEQIYFVGGDQDFSKSLAAFGARDLGAGRYELGKALRIDYKQRKEHAPDPEHDEWKHFFGIKIREDLPSGDYASYENESRPTAVFDAVHSRLLLEGGRYRIEDRGIVN